MGRGGGGETDKREGEGAGGWAGRVVVVVDLINVGFTEVVPTPPEWTRLYFNRSVLGIGALLLPEWRD